MHDANVVAVASSQQRAAKRIETHRRAQSREIVYNFISYLLTHLVPSSCEEIFCRRLDPGSFIQIPTTESFFILNDVDVSHLLEAVLLCSVVKNNMMALFFSLGKSTTVSA